MDVLEINVPPEELEEFKRSEDRRVVENNQESSVVNAKKEDQSEQRPKKSRLQFCEHCQREVSHFRQHFLTEHCPKSLFPSSFCFACELQCGSSSAKAKFHAECPEASVGFLLSWVELTCKIESFFCGAVGVQSLADLHLPDVVFSEEEKLYLSFREEVLSGSVPLDMDFNSPSVRFLHWRSFYHLLKLVSEEEGRQFASFELAPYRLPFTQSFVDSHFHLEKLVGKRPGVSLSSVVDILNKLESKSNLRLLSGIANFVFPEFWGDIDELVDQECRVHFSIGIHPNRVFTYGPISCRPWLPSPKCVGVGEVGLDLVKGGSSVSEQLEYLKHAVHLAREFDKVLILHCRGQGALLLVFDLLRQEGLLGLRLHLHCFNGSLEDVRGWLSYCPQVFFGVSPLVQWDRDLQSTVMAIPLSRVLVESDAPYLPKGASPWSAVEALLPVLSASYGVPGPLILHQAVLNARELYRF